MLSVVLATHNEANNLARCLASVKNLADEIIIADGESSDETVKIAQQYGAKVIQTTNKPNFHINKQMAMDAAQGELVLQLDADEVVDTELASFIESVHQTVGDVPLSKAAYQAWWIKRKNLFLGTFLKKGGQYPDPVIRLYLNGFARLPQKDVHEQMAVDGRVGWAEGHLEHYSNPTFAEYLRKFNTYTSFSAQQLYAAGTRATFSLGVRYFVVKPLKTFISLYLRHKGFLDGVPGLVFALMSSLHHPVVVLKLWELEEIA